MLGKPEQRRIIDELLDPLHPIRELDKEIAPLLLEFRKLKLDKEGKEKLLVLLVTRLEMFHILNERINPSWLAQVLTEGKLPMSAENKR